MLVLADFANTTGDPVFDGTLRQGLAVQLEQSPFLSIIADEKIQQTLGLMGQPRRCNADHRQIAREICVSGRRAPRYSTVRLPDWQEYSSDAQGGQLRRRTNAGEHGGTGERQRPCADALGSAATAMRNKLGESLSTIQKFDTPLEQATTPSLEALKAYSSGMQTIGTKGPDAATPFFKRAVELDPNFAVAYAYLGILATSCS